MCDPASIAMAGFAVSAASSVAGFAGQQAQYEIQQQQYEQNKANAIAAFQDKQVAYNTRIEQEQQATANNKFNTQLQAQAAESKAIASAGESGVSGTSVDQLIGDIQGRVSRYDANADTNLGWTTAQLQSEKTAAGDQAVSQINSVSPGVAPNFLDAGLRIAGGGLTAYNSYAQRTAGGVPGYGASNPYNSAGVGY